MAGKQGGGRGQGSGGPDRGLSTSALSAPKRPCPRSFVPVTSTGLVPPVGWGSGARVGGLGYMPPWGRGTRVPVRRAGAEGTHGIARAKAFSTHALPGGTTVNFFSRLSGTHVPETYRLHACELRIYYGSTTDLLRIYYGSTTDSYLPSEPASLRHSRFFDYGVLQILRIWSHLPRTRARQRGHVRRTSPNHYREREELVRSIRSRGVRGPVLRRQAGYGYICSRYVAGGP
jgi:hypothetical protein